MLHSVEALQLGYHLLCLPHSIIGTLVLLLQRNHLHRSVPLWHRPPGSYREPAVIPGASKAKRPLCWSQSMPLPSSALSAKREHTKDLTQA